MKAKDLMVGDWVSLSDPDFKEVDLYQISQIREDGIMVEMFSDIYDEEWFEPISLTKEILRNNGLLFQNYENGYDKWEIQTDSYSSWFVLSITHYIDDAGDWYMEDIPIHYVHELQHALRLCGLNDLADNLKIN